MAIQTFLGPILAGTQKNNNAVAVTSNTPSATFLQSGTGNSYRNTGAGDCFQFVSVPQATLTSIAAASFPSTITPVNTVSSVNYPLVLPAGAYIDNIDLIVNTPFTFSGAPTSLGIAVNFIGAPGSTYATAQTIATATITTSVTAGIYATGNTASGASASNPIQYTASATPLAMIQNTGPTDVMLQLVLTFSGGTTPAITAGALGFAFNYVLRNPDGSWYPITPPVPYTTPTGSTY